MTKINYLINGKEVELEVEDSFAQAYWEIQEETKREQEREKWRRRKKLLSLEGMDELGEYIESQEPNAEERMMERIDRKKQRLVMRLAFKALQPQQRKLFVRVFIKKETETAIAEEKGVTLSAISHQIERIRESYKKNLEKYKKIFD